MVHPAQREGLVQRLRARIGNPLEWREVDKCLLVACGTFPFCLAVALFNAQVLRNPSLAPFFDRGFLARHLLPAWAIVAWWGLLVGMGFLLRGRGGRHRWFTHLVIQSWLLQVSLLGYFIGPLTTPIGVTILVNGMIGYLLFDVKSVSLAFLTSLGLLVGTALAAQEGTIPYAPLIASPPFEVGRLAGWWFRNTGASFLIQVVGFLLGYVYVLTRWRDREAKLAVAYRELSETKDALVRSESLAAVGSLVTGAAHELRNPLSSSGGLFQSLREELAGSAHFPSSEKEEALRTIDMALKGQQRAALIAERLYSLTDALETRKSMAVLAEFLEALKRRYPKATITGGSLEGELRVPQAIVETILPNLLDNALAAGGQEPPRLEVFTQNGAVEFVVSDSGCGIPKAIQGEVFKPFFTGQKAGEGHGVGLGLYIVHELVTRLGGTVRLESEEGKGTRVKVRLPSGSASG